MSPALTLRDAEGPVGSYDRGERDGHVYADLFEREPGVSPARAARAVLDQLAGYRIAGDEALGRELIAAGARRLRRAARRLPAQRPWLIEVFRHPAHRGVGRAFASGHSRWPPCPGSA